MAKGVPASGVRRTKKRIAAGWFDSEGKVQMHIATAEKPHLVVNNVFKEPEIIETDAQISHRLKDRFDILGELTESALEGDTRSLIVSGPAGLGKSFTVEEKLNDWDPDKDNHKIIKGFVKMTGLFRMLWDYRHPGNVLVFDDADSLFFDDTTLNMLKAVCDTTEIRTVSYLTEYEMFDDSGEKLPKQFQFEGTIIFITNLDFDTMIEKGHRLAPHLSALVSRSHYIDLGMKSKRDYIIRIRQVCETGMLAQHGLNEEQEQDVLNFITVNQDRLRELSLRIAVKLANLRRTIAGDWERIARTTCLRNQ